MSIYLKTQPRLTRADVREIVRQELATREALMEPIAAPQQHGALHLVVDAFNALSFVANAGAFVAISLAKTVIR